MKETTTEEARRYLDYWKEEQDAIFLYRRLAEAERDPHLAEVLRKLAEIEARHASFWEGKLRGAGLSLPPHRPSWRARLLAWTARRFGAQAVLPMMVSLERGAFRVYDREPEAVGRGLPLEERSHARVFRYLSLAGRGLPGGLVGLLEGRHRAVGGNALRAGVLGANDGLVSNFSLVMGVAGASISPQAVLVAGLAGLLAGALSMAIGEWVSVQSAREMFQRQVQVEADEIAEVPDEEREELALIYQAKGLPEDQARAMAERLLQDPEKALDTLAREELGVDPEELGGSPWEAAGASFLFFALGAMVPILPFLFGAGPLAVGMSALLSGLALFGIGAFITLFTGRNPLLSGGRQALFGLVAAGITYGIGWLLGVTVAG